MTRPGRRLHRYLHSRRAVALLPSRRSEALSPPSPPISEFGIFQLLHQASCSLATSPLAYPRHGLVNARLASAVQHGATESNEALPCWQTRPVCRTAGFAARHTLAPLPWSQPLNRPYPAAACAALLAIYGSRMACSGCRPHWIWLSLAVCRLLARADSLLCESLGWSFIIGRISNSNQARPEHLCLRGRMGQVASTNACFASFEVQLRRRGRYWMTSAIPCWSSSSLRMIKLCPHSSRARPTPFPEGTV